MFYAPELESILKTLTVEQREIAEERLDSWEGNMIDDNRDVTPAQRLKTLHQIVDEFTTGFTFQPRDED